MANAYPVLRAEIDAAPAERDGEMFYILYDRAGVTGARLLLSPLGLLIAGRMDGTSSVLDITDVLGRELDAPVACGEVERVVTALEEAYFLEGPRFQDYQSQAARDFRQTPVRTAGSSGSAYPADPEELAAELDRMMADAPPPEEVLPVTGVLPRGVVVPHIDFMRGGSGYGQVYGMLARLPRPQTVVVIGTAHTSLHEMYSLCEKDFDTPMGPVRVDRELCGRIRKALGAGAERDVLAHRGEHSIELQAVWLRHIYGEDVRIVPLLAGSLGEYLEGDSEPGEAALVPAVRQLSECLGEAVDGGGVLLMASADLSHVGPRFGDSREVTNQFLTEVEEADRDYLEAVAVDPVAGLQSLAAHGDRYHVCGSACIFAVGLALKDPTVRLLGYHQAVTPEMRQAVTFAAMCLE